MAVGNDRLKKALHTPEEASVGEDDESIWLMSYADLMTLLFTLFVMLYASLLNDDSETLRRTLSNFVQGSGDGANAGGSKIEGVGQGSGIGSDITRQLSERIEQEAWLKDVQVSLSKNGLKLTFSSNLLFDLGVAELRSESQTTLEKMISIIQEKSPNIKVRIEGHTDDNPIRSGRFKSNWELSGARAAHIAALFEKYGMDPKNLIAIGYGESRPLKPNREPSGIADREAQKINRRVVITLYEDTFVENESTQKTGGNQ